MQTYAKNKKTKNIKIKLSGLDSFIFYALCILIFYPPFFRGLFFQKELLTTHVLSFTLGTVWLFSKKNIKEFKIVSSITDICALAVVFMYFISMFYGVNTRLAIAEFLKYANYFLIYLMVKDYSQHYPETKKTIINVLLFSGVIVSIIGIGSAIGIFSYNGAFVNNRINSTFQYPNTLAAYLIALFILGMGQLQVTTNKKEKYFYVILLNLFIFTFIPTMSRGMWLIAPIVLFIYFLLIPLNKKLNMFIYSIVTMVPAIGFSALFIQRLDTSSPTQWLLLTASILATVGLNFVKDKVIRITKISYKTVIGTITGSLVILGVMAAIVLNITEPLKLSNIDNQDNSYKILNRNISGVLKNTEYILNTSVDIKNPKDKPYAGLIDIYSIDAEGETERITRETINEVKDISVPFTTLDTTEYIRVRFLNYYGETEVSFNNAEISKSENGELLEDIKLKYKFIPEQLIARLDSIKATENSIQGRLAFYKDAVKIIKNYPILGTGGGGWETLYSMYQSYMYWTTQAHNYFLQLWIEVGIMGLLAYSLFIMSLLYSIYKTVRNSHDENTKTIEIAIFMSWATILVHSAMDFDLSLGAMQILLWTLFGLTTHRPISSESKLYRVAINKYVSIVLIIALLLGSFSLYTGQSYAAKAVVAYSQKDIKKTIESFVKANKFDPFNASFAIDLASLYMALGKNDETFISKSIETIEKAVNRQPHDTEVLKRAIELNIQQRRLNKGLQYADELIKIQPMNTANYLNQTRTYLYAIKHFVDNEKEDELNDVVNRLPNLRNNFENASQASMEPFKYNKDLDYNLQKIDYLLDNSEASNLDKVVMYNKWNMDIDNDGVPDGTRVTNTEKGNATIQLNEGIVSLKNDGEDYGIFRLEKLPLEPNSSYTLEIEYASTVQDNNFDIYVDDLTDGTNRFARLDNVKQTPEFETVKLELETTNDMEAGKQRILIIHRGNDTGEIQIKKLSIIED